MRPGFFLFCRFSVCHCRLACVGGAKNPLDGLVTGICYILLLVFKDNASDDVIGVFHPFWSFNDVSRSLLKIVNSKHLIFITIAMPVFINESIQSSGYIFMVIGCSHAI
ncbi:hypothetical protein AZ021_002458 [Enterobacter ludwigii]|nr:hypothetical protein AZ021_002458 [Enterobacter ludwigii]